VLSVARNPRADKLSGSRQELKSRDALIERLLGVRSPERPHRSVDWASLEGAESDDEIDPDEIDPDERIERGGGSASWLQSSAVAHMTYTSSETSGQGENSVRDSLDGLGGHALRDAKLCDRAARSEGVKVQGDEDRVRGWLHHSVHVAQLQVKAQSKAARLQARLDARFAK